MIKKSVSLVSAIVLLIPSASIHSASTTNYQQLMDRAVATYAENGPTMGMTQARVTYEEFTKNKKQTGTNIKFTLRNQGRAFPRNITQLDDADASLSVLDVDVLNDGKREHYPHPIDLDYQIINNVAYLRMSHLSDELKEKIKESESKYTDEKMARALNTWVSFDLTQFVPFLKPQEGDDALSPASHDETSEMLLLTKKLSTIKTPLIVRRGAIEQFEGSSVAALQVTFNPKLLAVLRQQAEKSVKTTNKKQRAQEIAQIRKAYAAMQKTMNSSKITMYVQPETATLVGYRVVMSKTEPRESFKQVGKTYKSVVVGTRRIAIDLSVSTQPIQDTTLTPPEGVMTLEEYAKIFEDPVQE